MHIYYVDFPDETISYTKEYVQNNFLIDNIPPNVEFLHQSIIYENKVWYYDEIWDDIVYFKKYDIKLEEDITIENIELNNEEHEMKVEEVL